MMEIIKNKEEVKSVMNIIQAFADGKTIQAIDPYEDEWVDQVGLNFKALFEGQYRIKPEPKYRPFKNAEECWAEMSEHQPFGFTKFKNAKSGYYMVTFIASGATVGMNNIPFSYENMFDSYTFADGTPFGIKDEE
jgi:hypothetical protein